MHKNLNLLPSSGNPFLPFGSPGPKSKSPGLLVLFGLFGLLA